MVLSLQRGTLWLFTPLTYNIHKTFMPRVLPKRERALVPNEVVDLRAISKGARTKRCT
jgi:hypothetical protein